MTAAQRKCKKCEKEFPLTSQYFQPNKDSVAGLRRVCRLCVSTADAAKRNETPEKQAAARQKTKDWRSKNRRQDRVASQITNAKYRILILKHYGGDDPKCACCGERGESFLALDHINNDGGIHRRAIGRGIQVYKDVVRNNYPDSFQLLCHNCNFSKGKHGVCQHKLPQVEGLRVEIKLQELIEERGRIAKRPRVDKDIF